MRLCTFAWLIASLASLNSFGQAGVSTTASYAASKDSTPVTVYSAASGATAPELIPFASAPQPIARCKGKVDGTVSLFFVVDTDGVPRNLMFDRPLGSELDRFALQIAGADRFKPGTLHGVPVVVAEGDEIRLQACSVNSKDSSGQKTQLLQLRALPDQQLSVAQVTYSSTVLTTPATPQELENGSAKIYQPGAEITPPKLLFFPDPDWPVDAPGNLKSGTCFFSLIVDSQGMPHHLELTPPPCNGLDRNAAEAIHRYRFKPAMKNGEPVPAQIAVDVTFRIYH